MRGLNRLEDLKKLDRAAAQAELEKFLQERLGISTRDAAIGGGTALGMAGIGAIADADGGDAVGGALLGTAIPGAMAIDRHYRRGLPALGKGDLVKLIAASGGAGAGGSILLDMLGG